MDTIRQIGQHRPVLARNDNAGLIQADAGCKILPFRRTPSPKPLEDDGDIRQGLPRELTHGYPFPESGRFQVACLAQYPDADPCQAVYPNRWLKRVLLASAFTAWTVAAIAISIALG